MANTGVSGGSGKPKGDRISPTGRSLRRARNWKLENRNWKIGEADPLPPLFLELRILKELRVGVFASAHSKGLKGTFEGWKVGRLKRRKRTKDG